MNTVERLRPEPAPLDPVWSETTLASILADPAAPPRASRRRRSQAVIASLLAASVVGAGAAYAGGLVPSFVVDAFDGLVSGTSEDFDVSGVRPIADFTLPDGTRYTVWRGRNQAGGSCEAAKEDRPGKNLDNFHADCFSGGSAARYEPVSFGWVQLPEPAGQDQNPMYYVAFGEAPRHDATSVRITGDGTDVALPIDPVTSGFGGNLSGLVAPAEGLVDLRFSFLDASGRQVAVLHYPDELG